jgi:thioredoxin 1
MAGENTLQFTDSAFDQDVLNSEVPVLVDFWAPWCGPCKAMTPTVDALASEYAGKVKIGKLNTDENPATAMRYQVRGIPTLLLFKGGKVVDQRVGAMPKPEVQKMIDPHVPAGAPTAAPTSDRSATPAAPAESSQPAQPQAAKP